jgi:hypothetical protein
MGSYGVPCGGPKGPMGVYGHFIVGDGAQRTRMGPRNGWENMYDLFQIHVSHACLMFCVYLLYIHRTLCVHAVFNDSRPKDQVHRLCRF